MRKFKGLTKQQDRKICKVVEKQMKNFLKTLEERNFDIVDFSALFLEYNKRNGKFFWSFEMKGSEHRFYLKEDFEGYGSNEIDDDDLESLVIINTSEFIEESEHYEIYRGYYESFQIMLENYDELGIFYRDYINPLYNQIIKSDKKAFKSKRNEKSKAA